MKRLDPDLPFYLWTAQDPYDHPLVPFDGREDEDHGDHGYGARHERLHRLQRNAREDPAIFVAGRALIPPRHHPLKDLQWHSLDLNFTTEY